MFRKYSFPFCLALITLISASPVIAKETLTLTQLNSGRSIEAELLHLDGQEVTIRLKSGKTHSLQLNTLTPESVQEIQDYSKSRSDVQAEASLAVNEIIGVPLFGQAISLWDESAAQVANRISLTKESSVDVMQSYRRYTAPTESFLGAHPYCITLYSSPENKAGQLSLVFANKGDYDSKVGQGEDHFKKVYAGESPPLSLEDAIELDAKVITNTLTKKFGEPETQYFGEKTDRRRVKRWNWRDHAFVLSELDLEYVSLLIVPLDIADTKGKVVKINDGQLKAIKAKNVFKESNGDVRIVNIPMVNQGPKGYCVPATLERAMRYMGVPADMYLLAVSATSQERGTVTSLLVENLEQVVRSKGRRFKTLDFVTEVRMKDVKKYIDTGVPILWGMRSLPSYNNIANTRSEERKRTQDFKAWAMEIQKEADRVSPAFKLASENNHICMIVGYNEATNELAVSDSWGPRYELRWIHLDIASAVTSSINKSVRSYVLTF